MAITFISHSSAKTEEDQANADSVRTELIKRLPDLGWDVRVDDLLPPGTDWRSVLYGWLADCDAAVVLVSKDGLESTWLKREVHILLWRRAVGSRLTIVPVLLKGLSPRELRRSELSQLADLQCVLQDETEPADLVSLIVERLGDLGGCADNSAMRAMTTKIEHCLDEVTDRFTLRSMAHRLGSEGTGASRPRPRSGAMSRTRSWPRCPPRRCRRPSTKWSSSRTRPAEQAHQPAAPHLDRSPGRTAAAPGERRVVATLAGARAETAEQHIHRASCFSGAYWVKAVDLVAGEAQHEEHMTACLTAICALLKSDDENELPIEGEVLFLVIDPAGTELGVVGHLVRTLIGRFSWLNIIVLTDRTDPADLGVPTAGAVHIPVQPGAEGQMARTRRALKEIRDRRSGHGKDAES
ncbi:toll/interleukin-1 receptor domain-containing protein [Streptomyces sp. MS1.AVA.1]|uniref:Toll/interleukin-1 receptor domain-containing protein n=1 Tax=Streptomyces machairae TaxID=3134109 RepID=A0ABU8UJU9_9ACTN